MKKLSRVVWGSLAACLICVAVGGAERGAFARGGNKERDKATRAMRQGEFEVAEKIYRTLVEKNAKDTPARLGLSYALLKQRKLKDAFDEASRTLTYEPSSARARALLGSALLSSGDFPRAVEAFRSALTLKDDEPLAIAGLSMVNFYENRPAIALAGMRRAMYLEPREPDFIFSFAQAAARSEQYREAADAYENFLRIAPRTDADRRARIVGLIDFLRYLGAQRNLYLTGGASRSVVPFELANSRPIIDVRVNGVKAPLRFVIDTGSGMCVISTEAATRLNIKQIARGGLARAVGGGGRFEIVYGFLSSLQIGEVRMENVPVYIRHFHNQQEPVDGYIGLSVLIKYLASVDYGTRHMTLVRQPERTIVTRNYSDILLPAPLSLNSIETNADTPPPQVSALAATTTVTKIPKPKVVNTVPDDATKRSYEFPIRATSSGFWSSAVFLDGVEKPLNFIVDTGASISVVSQKLTETEDMSRFEQKTRLRVFGAAGVTEDVTTLLLPRITLGDYTHSNLPAAVLDMSAINETTGFEQTGIIGGNILRRFRVTFDFQRGIVRLDPLATPPPPSSAPATRDANITPASGASQ